MGRRNRPESVPRPGTAEVRWQEDSHLLDEASAKIEELDLIAGHLSIKQIDALASKPKRSLNEEEKLIVQTWEEYQEARRNWMDDVMPRFSPFRNDARAFERRLGKYRSFTRRYNNKKFAEIRTEGDTTLEMYRNREETLEQAEDYIHGQTDTNLARLKAQFESSMEDVEGSRSTELINIVDRFRDDARDIVPYNLRPGQDKQVAAITLAYEGDVQQYILATKDDPETQAILERHAEILEKAWDATEATSNLDDVIHQVDIESQAAEVTKSIFERAKEKPVLAGVAVIASAYLLYKAYGLVKDGLNLEQKPGIVKLALGVGVAGATAWGINELFIKGIDNDSRNGALEMLGITGANPTDGGIWDRDPRLQEVQRLMKSIDEGDPESAEVYNNGLYMATSPITELIKAYENGKGDERMNFSGTSIDAEAQSKMSPGPAFRAMDMLVMAAYKNSIQEGTPASNSEESQREIGLAWLKSQGYRDAKFGSVLMQFTSNVDWAEVSEDTARVERAGINYPNRALLGPEGRAAEVAVSAVFDGDNVDTLAIGNKGDGVVVLINGYPYIYRGDGEDSTGTETVKLVDYYDSSRSFEPPANGGGRRERGIILAHGKDQMIKLTSHFGQTPRFNEAMNRWEVRGLKNKTYGGLLTEQEHTGIVGVDIRQGVSKPKLVPEGMKSTDGVDHVNQLPYAWEKMTLAKELQNNYPNLFTRRIIIDSIKERGAEVKVSIDYGSRADQKGVLVFKAGAIDETHPLSIAFLKKIEEDKSVERQHQAVAKEIASSHREQVEQERIVRDLQSAFANTSRTDSWYNEPISLFKGLMDRASKAWEGEVDFFEIRSSNYKETVAYTLDVYQAALQQKAFEVARDNPTAGPDEIRRLIEDEFKQMDDEFLGQMDSLYIELQDDLDGNPHDSETQRNQLDTYEEYSPRVEALAYQNDQFRSLRQLIRDDMDGFDWTGFDSLMGAKEDQRLCLKLIDAYAWPLPIQATMTSSRYQTLSSKPTSGSGAITPAEAQELKEFQNQMIYLRYLRGEFERAMKEAAARSGQIDERVLYTEVVRIMDTRGIKMWSQVSEDTDHSYTSIQNGSPFESVRISSVTGSVERLEISDLEDKKAELQDVFKPHRVLSDNDNPLNQMIDLHLKRFYEIMEKGYRQEKANNGGQAPTERDFDNNVFDILKDEAELMVLSLDSNGVWANDREVATALDQLSGSYFLNLEAYPQSMLWKASPRSERTNYDVANWDSEYTEEWQKSARVVSKHINLDFESDVFMGRDSDVFYFNFMKLFQEKSNYGMYHQEFLNSQSDSLDLGAEFSPEAYTRYFLEKCYFVLNGTMSGYSTTAFERMITSMDKERLEDAMEKLELAATRNEGTGDDIFQDYYHWVGIGEYEETGAIAGTPEQGEAIHSAERMSKEGLILDCQTQIRGIAAEMDGALWLEGAVFGAEALDNAFLDHANQRLETIVAQNRTLSVREFEQVLMEYRMFLRVERDLVYSEARKHGVLTENRGIRIRQEIINPSFDGAVGAWDPTNASTTPEARIAAYRTKLQTRLNESLRVELDQLGVAREQAIKELQNEMDLSAWYHDAVGSNTADWQGVFDDSIADRVGRIHDDFQLGGMNVLEFKAEMLELKSFLMVEKHFVYGPLMESGNDASLEVIQTYAREIEPIFESHWGTLGSISLQARNTSAYQDAIIDKMEDKLDTQELAKEKAMADFRDWFEGDSPWTGMSEMKWHDSVEYFLRGSGEWHSRIFVESVTYRVQMLNDRYSDPVTFNNKLNDLKPYLEAEYHAVVSPAMNTGLNADAESQIKWQEFLFGNPSEVRPWEVYVERDINDPYQPNGIFWHYWENHGMSAHTYEREIREHFERNINGYLPGWPGGQ